MRMLFLAVALVAIAGGAGCAGDLMGGATADEMPSAVAENTGFPCDVRAVLQASCAPCHAGTTYLHPLKTREVWLARRADGLSIGEFAAWQVATGKMPPPAAAAQPTDEERAILVDWVAAGMPAGACASLTPPRL
jgi:uncharacterized membrane protein